MSATTADFNCAICLDVAEEPVVTRCGHLFCWSCLDQWLHRPDAVPDCPMCKGRVDESIPGDIIPIYGKGAKGKNSTSSNTTTQANASAIHANTNLSSSSAYLPQEDATVETVVEGGVSNNNSDTSSSANTIFQESANVPNVNRHRTSTSDNSESFSHLHRPTSHATSHSSLGETPAMNESQSSHSGNASSGRHERNAEHPRPSAARAPTPPRPAHRFNIHGYGMPLQFGSFFFIFGGGMGSGIMMLMVAMWAVSHFIPWREWLHSARNYLSGQRTSNHNANQQTHPFTTPFAHRDDTRARTNNHNDTNNNHNYNNSDRDEENVTHLFGTRPTNAQMPHNALEESENTARLMLIALVVIFVLYGFLWTM